jgi:hypothetical protein
VARTDIYPPKNLEALGEQLRSFLAASGDSPTAGGVAESFQVRTVGLQDFRESGLKHAVWKGVWHHQLRSAGGGRAETFARSLGCVSPEVRSIYRSPLAGEIDRAIDTIDNDPAFEDDASLVRLLEIPDAHLTAIWISNAKMNRLIPLGQFASSEDQFAGDHAKQEMEGVPVGVQKSSINEAELIQRLPEKSIIGLSQTPPPGRRPEFT